MNGSDSSNQMARHPANPVLTEKQVPYPSALVFNAGVAKWKGRYVMVFRNDYGDSAEKRLDGTNIGLAWSDDGVSWEVAPRPVFAMNSREVKRAYDPRLTVIDDRAYMCFAVDTHHGIRGGIAVTDDFERFEILSLSTPDNRNMVLFPTLVGGKYARLERPFPIYGRGAPEAFDMWFSDSPDMRYWGNSQLVLGSERVPWANRKIGPAAPPVSTPAGWLALFHAVDVEEGREFRSWHSNWRKRYTAGAVLLDHYEPWRVIGMTREPLLAPDPAYPYEVDGYRGHVIFPTGVVLEPGGELKVWYGASDTVIALATMHVKDVLSLCEPVG